MSKTQKSATYASSDVLLLEQPETWNLNLLSAGVFVLGDPAGDEIQGVSLREHSLAFWIDIHHFLYSGLRQDVCPWFLALLCTMINSFLAPLR